MDLLFYICAGAGVGLAVGLTGVGGGSLMTPLLILWGVPEKIAIGTDLLYAAATKTGAMVSHHRQRTIRWRMVGFLAAGSIPASLATSLYLKYFLPPDFDYGPSLTSVLGFMLILTSVVVFFRKKLGRYMAKQSFTAPNAEPQTAESSRRTDTITFIAGLVLGVLVTLSSVGAGAFCAALLLMLYPKLRASNVVGTDIAHAVPLTLVAGLGHMWNGNFDLQLMIGLLIGSLPAVHFGAKAATKVPNTVLQPILASLLMAVGIKFALFA